MGKIKTAAIIVANENLCEDIFDMRLRVPEVANFALAGQFVSLYLNSKEKLLPRPISICEILGDELRLVYRAGGSTTGTYLMSSYKPGEKIEVMGALGNGFIQDSDDSILIGGGVGIPPMLELSKRLGGKKKVLLGYRNSSNFLAEEFSKYADVYVATEDGSLGTRGNVLDILKKYRLGAKKIYACGPTAMLRAVKDYAMEHDIAAELSLEERMACGIGACFACVCKTEKLNPNTNVYNTRVCKEGPVFDAREVVL